MVHVDQTWEMFRLVPCRPQWVGAQMSGCRGEKTGCPCPLAGAPRLQLGKETDFQPVTVELSSRRVRWWYCDSLGGIPVFFPPTELKNRVNSDIIVKASLWQASIWYGLHCETVGKHKVWMSPC